MQIKVLHVRRETAGLLRQFKRPLVGWHDTAIPAPEDGWIFLPISNDTAEELAAMRFPDESDEELLLRLIGTKGRPMS